MPPDDRHPVAVRVKSISETVWLRLFFVPVFLIGAGFFSVVTFWPLWQILDARHWQETPCVVESSQVVAHQGDDSTSYSIEVVYHYCRAGQPYTSRRYNFVAGSWSGYRAKQAVVARYPSGRETVCFVNPKAPEEAKRWKARVAPFVDEWTRTTPDGEKVLAAFRAEIAKLRKGS